MNVFVLGKVSLGAGIVPDLVFWLIVWWAGWFAILLIWYDKKQKEPMTVLVCFFMFAFSALIPLFAIYHTIRKALKRK
jgi:predicted membrane channel-forming protein YqfA (hemolysin III family)